MQIIDRSGVVARLDHATCIELMHAAMIALAKGLTKQLLRGIIDLGDGDAFGVMPGAMHNGFGAKIVSVFPDAPGGRSHQGVIVVFDRETGAPAAVVDAGEVTAIRTACASATATRALARADASHLAILGTGEQAWQHALAIRHVRDLTKISIWGRDPEKAKVLAERLSSELGLPVTIAEDVRSAVSKAQIICTTTAASEPILYSADVADGTHINVVGSSRLGPSEIDTALVARSRFFPDHRDGVLAQGEEFARARNAGLIDEAHVLPEIGNVLAGEVTGRMTNSEVTIYKSLGSIVQDLACAAYLASCN